MLTIEQQAIIEACVDEKYYDKKRLLKYLIMHDIVGNEIFAYCDKSKGSDRSYHSRFLDDEYGYNPLPIETFIRRVPFYFYTPDPENPQIGKLGDLHDILYSSLRSDTPSNKALEAVYLALEYLYYEVKQPLENIFNYWINQFGVVSGDGFSKWHHYIQLCVKLGRSNYYPEHFITAYNYVLELVGLPPIIYEITECGLGDPCYRNGTTLEFEGRFPCDENGNPIMKWIGIHVKNPGKISCSCDRSRSGYLRIEIKPNTVAYVLNFFNNQDEERDYWYQVYAGPQTMEFDYSVLKRRRNALGFTQQQVADAVSTSVRTYQKWENGETTPDGHFLLRLLNWLDIPDIQDVIHFNEIYPKEQ